MATALNRNAPTGEYAEPSASPWWDFLELDADLPAGTQLPIMLDPLLSLNEAQTEAVTTTEGPVLVIAGPGSGKTRVITHRVAYLISQGKAKPWQIFAATFTNKAAREMRERIANIIPQDAPQVTMGTFHSFCARILRRHAAAIGLDQNFTIYDDDDQQEVVRLAMQMADISPDALRWRDALTAISHAKSDLKLPSWALADAQGDFHRMLCARTYHHYQRILARHNALDFDDLLVKAVYLLESSPEIRSIYHQRYKYLMVDEFQDTNLAQYALVKLLTGPHNNICVVGDPDQNIYTWRKAEIGNILGFSNNFPGTKQINVGRNYRSTGLIIKAAEGLVARNEERIERGLFTEAGDGYPVMLYRAYNSDDEARWVIAEIGRLVSTGDYQPDDCAIMYRTNAQSRAFEEHCIRQGLPYQLVGGTRFYQRREVKDAIAYLRVIYNPADEVSLVRALRTPPRGIGDASIREMVNRTAQADTTLMATLREVQQNGRTGPLQLPRTAREGVAIFVKFMDDLILTARESGVAELLDRVLKASGMINRVASEDDSEERLANLQELRNLAAEYGPSHDANGLAAFLERVALFSTIDSHEENTSRLTLISLHQSKGLEFPVVFVSGLEDGLLPISMATEQRAIEEERRLCYVGMTRAKERLYMTLAFYSTRSRFRAEARVATPSRFLREIPTETLRPLPPDQITEKMVQKDPVTNRATGNGEVR